MVKQNIKVYIRVRPPLPREIKDGIFENCVLASEKKIYVSLTVQPLVIDKESDSIPGVAIYSYDKVFDYSSTQEDIYSEAVDKSVKSVVQEGLNATLFAYGQTGSGKTYTMYGGETND